MSAGGLSYSGLVNYGVATLPSVDSWGTNMNILRDPPKSITTRRIDKVGQTSSITEMIDDSGNRACEAIQVYARGVNPCVSVSYSNAGNNGGQRSGGLQTGGVTQAKLPYTIIKDGAFRPPVRRQEDLLPLSRQPRVWTSAFSQPGFVDFSRKLRSCGSAAQTKEVQTHRLKACVRPTATYKIEKPLRAPRNVKDVIQNPIHSSVSSGMRTQDITQQHVLRPTKEIENNPLHAHAQSQFSDPKHNYVNNNEFDSQRFIQDIRNPKAVTNPNSNKNNTTSLEDLLDLPHMPVKDIRTVNIRAAHSGNEKTSYIHDDIKLSRGLPEYQTRTNRANPQIYKRIAPRNEIQLKRSRPKGQFSGTPGEIRGPRDHGSRTQRLIPKIKAGGFSIPASKPLTQRIQNQKTPHESEKARISRSVLESMQSRFGPSSPV